MMSWAGSDNRSACLQGWSWVEEGWVVDHQGIADNAVDADGWSYATDFSWLRIPPAPNAGHRSKVRLLGCCVPTSV